MTIGTSWLSKSARSLRMMCALGLAATAFSPPATAADLQTEPINLSKATALGDSDYAKAWNLGRLGVTTIEGAPDHGSATFDAWKVLSTRMDFGLNYHQPAVDASLRRYLENPATLKDAIPTRSFICPTSPAG